MTPSTASLSGDGADPVVAVQLRTDDRSVSVLVGVDSVTPSTASPSGDRADPEAAVRMRG
ncbi:hypothetical protein [Burkholderia sp. BCC1993]|uniref:hypothetical protein n=1 Tax=Burkholderia sp. BCC1993 TaxID=2817444 RepID=UPI002AB0C270|nr:hypothetical protein [Burkholderia sp. BCC1993]